MIFKSGRINFHSIFIEELLTLEINHQSNECILNRLTSNRLGESNESSEYSESSESSQSNQSQFRRGCLICYYCDVDTNRDVLPDDLVSVFYKQSCQFCLATHLFGSELKVLFSQETAPRGIRFRISPTSHSDL